MLWQKGRASDNVVQDTGRGGGGGGFGGRGLGLGGIIVVVIVGLLFGKDPGQILQLLGDMGGDGGAPGQQQVTAPANDEQSLFVRKVLGSTEDVWGQMFQASGQRYAAPRLVLFNGAVQSACGAASAAMGPFYCPGDQQVYLDLDFFREMQTRFHAAGDFARAYVIAHEVGHHVQNLIGVMAKVEQAARGGTPMQGAEGLSVRQELQADCFAGVWANHAQQQLNWLEPGDIDAALNAANQIGDDTLQKQARGYVVPDSFTHGSSAERVRWFKAGFAAGQLGACDTFAARTL
ncbi:MAG: neutral zinc metallopeptidase [Dokdonella sp.]|uniref:KPN_02809 family neutral zinc metallopeptidase n=1 Tax=Dokdonella sp. TaxID=2291710 RepID=UPI0025BEE479|nr:neutral zinc metallopeptidase [Dokdonella sp.]MBX3700018.1 neutral zinc metallopeptidase [Dokdonella sp.]MCW5577251.1 neutral zinc metallopeptidase [Dokdonella sp.]